MHWHAELYWTVHEIRFHVSCHVTTHKSRDQSKPVTIQFSGYSGGSRGGNTAPPPPLKFDRLCFLIPFSIRMLKNTAQIAALESINTPESFQGLMRAIIDPAVMGPCASRSWCACTYSLNKKEWICSLFKECILEKSEIRVNLE